ncbi:MAG TPA: hypothetical protein VGI56_12480 [Galbitalea sp.]|jgi:hypothetical protein
MSPDPSPEALRRGAAVAFIALTRLAREDAEKAYLASLKTAG